MDFGGPKRVISLGGVRHRPTGKKEVLDAARAEREKRRGGRERDNAALRIQAVWRGRTVARGVSASCLSRAADLAALIDMELASKGTLASADASGGGGMSLAAQLWRELRVSCLRGRTLRGHPQLVKTLATATLSAFSAQPSSGEEAPILPHIAAGVPLASFVHLVAWSLLALCDAIEHSAARIAAVARECAGNVDAEAAEAPATHGGDRRNDSDRECACDIAIVRSASAAIRVALDASGWASGRTPARGAAPLAREFAARVVTGVNASAGEAARCSGGSTAALADAARRRVACLPAAVAAVALAGTPAAIAAAPAVAALGRVASGAAFLQARPAVAEALHTHAIAATTRPFAVAAAATAATATAQTTRMCPLPTLFSHLRDAASRGGADSPSCTAALRAWDVQVVAAAAVDAVIRRRASPAPQESASSDGSRTGCAENLERELSAAATVCACFVLGPLNHPLRGDNQRNVDGDRDRSRALVSAALRPLVACLSHVAESAAAAATKSSSARSSVNDPSSPSSAQHPFWSTWLPRLLGARAFAAEVIDPLCKADGSSSRSRDRERSRSRKSGKGKRASARGVAVAWPSAEALAAAAAFVKGGPHLPLVIADATQSAEDDERGGADRHALALHFVGVAAALLRGVPPSRPAILVTLFPRPGLVRGLWSLCSRGHGFTDASGFAPDALTLLCGLFAQALDVVTDDELRGSRAASTAAPGIIPSVRRGGGLERFARLTLTVCLALCGSIGAASSAAAPGTAGRGDPRSPLCPAIVRPAGRYLLLAASTALRALHGRRRRGAVGVLGEALAEDAFWLECDAVIRASWAREMGAGGGIASLSPSTASIVAHAPFVVPFEDRLALFRNTVRGAVHARDTLWVKIRRTHLVADALSLIGGLGERVRDVNLKIVFIDAHGGEEAGIDDGGLFKEFIHTFFRVTLDPGFGCFARTDDGRVFPSGLGNRSGRGDLVHLVGAMLGKALCEGLVCDMTLTDAMLRRALGALNSIEDLEQLDPELLRNLRFVASYDGDVEADLAMDFTADVPVAGSQGSGRADGDRATAPLLTRQVELLPGGAAIPVTRANRLEFVHRRAAVAFSVHEPATRAFLHGLWSVIDASWLRIFDATELGVVVGGSAGDAPVDVDDWRSHTELFGGYSSSSRTIQNFWSVVRDFEPDDVKALLRFVTSSPRPPHGGFAALHPRFSIRRTVSDRDASGGSSSAGSFLAALNPFAKDESRLPSASTCFNLLKLPAYRSKKTLREKLLYAIHSGAGFGLS